MLKRVALTCLTMTLLMIVSIAHAADTTETFDVGATDFEFFLGYDGIGLDKYKGSIGAEALIGYGFMERFSGHLTVAGESNEYLGAGSGNVTFGIFGTPVDTDHFDLDLFLDAGFATDEFGVTPALELNFDLAPNLQIWGVYIRVEEALAGRDESVEDDPTTPNVNEAKASYAFAPSTAMTIGTYWTVAENHQLLLEYDMTIANNPTADANTLEIGGVAFGYNVMLSDSIEMINQVSFDIPQKGERFSVGVRTGIIVTLPGAGE